MWGKEGKEEGRIEVVVKVLGGRRRHRREKHYECTGKRLLVLSTCKQVPD